MRIPSGATGLIVAIVAVGLLGAGLEAGVGDAEQVDRVEVDGDRFTSHTRLCPPATFSDSVLWVATGAADARVGFEPQESETIPLPAESLLRRQAYRRAVNVVGYDSLVTASAALTFGTQRGLGAGASACAAAASDHWYFAQGSTENDFEQRMVLYNPFPEEASVRMTLYNDRRPRSPALLSDLPVPANDYAVVDFVEKTNPEFGRVATEIIANRGRVVAWRIMVVRAESVPQGAEFSLGTPTTSTMWYFPDGARDDDTFTSLHLLNLSDDEASVRVSLAAERRLLQPPGLEEIVIPPRSSRPLGLERALRREDLPPTFGIIVESTTPIVAERTIGSSGAQPGRSSEVGASQPSSRWSLPPVGIAATRDRLIAINPGSRRVALEVVLARAEGPALQPERLQVGIPPGARVVMPLEEWREQAPFAAIVSANGPVVVERVAWFGGDRSSAIGIPLPD